MPEGSFSTPDIQLDIDVREIMSMSNSKSTGFDNISVKFLKISIHVIADIVNIVYINNRRVLAAFFF